MARPRKMQRLNDAKSEVIAENFLKQDPENFPETKDYDPAEVVIAKHVPEYRKVIFLNGRDPGIPLDFHYSSKYHPLKLYKLLHGHEYDLPAEVIDHLEQCAENQYGYQKGADGHPQMYVTGKRYLYQLRPVKKVA